MESLSFVAPFAYSLDLLMLWTDKSRIVTVGIAAEVARMPKELQLQILGEFRGLPQQVIGTELDDFGKLERGGRILHRFRIGDVLVEGRAESEGGKAVGHLADDLPVRVEDAEADREGERVGQLGPRPAGHR